MVIGSAGRLARVSALEASLATQLKDVEVSMKQHSNQLHKMDPKLSEIDIAELTLKRLQEEVRRPCVEGIRQRTCDTKRILRSPS
jgi:hypothetical protein